MDQPPEKPPVDLKRIQDIAEGDRAFEEEVLRAYLSDCEERLERLAKSVPGGDVQSARRDAHTIKGASSNIGANRIHEIARDLEKCDIAKEPERAQALLDAVNAEFILVREFLEAYLSGGS